jgi:Skp family chaperone for outer membrane proteins
MAGVAKASGTWSRRAVFGLALLPLGRGLAWGQEAVLIVSRKRLLNETEPARNLLKAEIDLTAALQHQVDQIKARLTAEEQELARLRPTLQREAFDARVAEFDKTVRQVRRQTQRRAAALQNAFRDLRLQFVKALGPVLEEVRVARGALVILNADQILLADPAVDVTSEVIARINATVPTPPIPTLEQLDALLDDLPDQEAPQDESEEPAPQ